MNFLHNATPAQKAAAQREKTLAAIREATENGTVQTPYTLQELVGKGSFGSVFKGINNETKQVVAIKVLNLDQPGTSDLEDARKEIAMLSNLKQSECVNVTPYYGSFLLGTKLWVIMDYCGGGSVRTLAKAGKLDEKYIMVILRETLVGLQYIHKLGIIHRDLKAANILVNNDGRVQLCDFGVSAQLSSHHGKRQTLVGTPWWMAPELISGNQYSYKADIWSLGITLLEMANGRPPHSNEDVGRVLMLIPTQPPPRLEGGNWSQGLREIIALCLNERPEDRLSAEELLKSKIVKGIKAPTSILRELIARYDLWIKKGGNRVTLFPMAGEKFDAEEETGEDDDDGWDFEDVQKRLSFTRPYVTESGNNSPAPDSPPTIKPQRPGLVAVQGYKGSAPAGDHPLLRIFSKDPNQPSAPPNAGIPAVNSEPNIRNMAGGNRAPSPEATFKGITIPDLDDFDPDATGPSAQVNNRQLAHPPLSSVMQIEIPDFPDDPEPHPPAVQQQPTSVIPSGSNVPKPKLQRADSVGAPSTGSFKSSLQGENRNNFSPPSPNSAVSATAQSPRRFGMPVSAPASPPRSQLPRTLGQKGHHLPSKSVSSTLSRDAPSVPPLPSQLDLSAGVSARLAGQMQAGEPSSTKPTIVAPLNIVKEKGPTRPKDLNLKLPPQGLSLSDINTNRLGSLSPGLPPSNQQPGLQLQAPPPPQSNTAYRMAGAASMEMPFAAHTVNMANVHHSAPKEALVGELEKLLGTLMNTLASMDDNMRIIRAERKKMRQKQEAEANGGKKPEGRDNNEEDQGGTGGMSV